jgi:hypothetical protein
MQLNPTKTRFATNFEWLFKLRPIIEQTVVDLDWTIFVNASRGNHCQKSFTKTRTI